jgi:hypothetical protein
MATPRRLRVVIASAMAAAPIAAFGWFGCGREPTAPQTEQVSAARGGLQQDLEAAIRAKDRHSAQLLKTPGVVGVAVARDNAGRAAVLMLTTAPGIAGLPATLDGIPVIVKVTGLLVALPLQATSIAATPGRGRISASGEFAHPVPIGVSTSNVTANVAAACATGTLAARVTNGANVYALSANHIYALTNSAATGTSVVQPGLLDDDCVIGGTVFTSDPDGPNDASDVIGTLASFHTIAFCAGATCPDNTIDAAIALSSTANLGKATPLNGYGTPNSGTVSASLGQRVEKYGRSTELTTGRVIALDATVMIDYGGGQIAQFVHQIVIGGGGFAKAGDSGSLVVSQDGLHPVGLLFAGTHTVTIANPISDVLTAFGVTVDGS